MEPRNQEEVFLTQLLLTANRGIEAVLLDKAKRLRAKGDRRWFFTFAHGMITKRINDKIHTFEKPAKLLVFNIDFASTYLDALSRDERGESVPQHWKESFEFCEGSTVVRQAKFWWTFRTSPKRALEGDAEAIGAFAPTIACGQVEANAHINVDIAESLRKLQCDVSLKDFSNMLPYIEAGAEDAIRELYGNDAATFVLVLKKMSPKLEEQWRNAIFKKECNLDVPKPDIHLYLQLE